MRPIPADQWSSELSNCFSYDAANPHPGAYCPACRNPKRSVLWAACSAVCAGILGVAMPPPVAQRRAWERPRSGGWMGAGK